MHRNLDIMRQELSYHRGKRRNLIGRIPTNEEDLFHLKWCLISFVHARRASLMLILIIIELLQVREYIDLLYE